MSDLSINPRLLVLILIGIGIFGLLMPNFFLGLIFSPFHQTLKDNKNIEQVNGLLRNNSTIAETLLAHPEVQNALASGNVDSLYIYSPPVTILVTPTPDGINYFANEYQNGTRQLGHPFSWYRHDINLPNNNLKVSANVYDYRIFPSFHYQDLEMTDAIGQGYIEQKPVNPNDEFLFVFVSIYEDEIISAKSPNVWLPTQKNFGVISNNVQYEPVEYPYQINIRELEVLGNYNDNSQPQAFGQYVQYIPEHANTNELFNNGTQMEETESPYAGMTSVSDNEIPKGSSNMEDGYILFEIAKTTDINNIKVLGQFFSFGNAQWLLTNKNDIIPTETITENPTYNNGGFINAE
jgi:hypothetical protein